MTESPEGTVRIVVAFSSMIRETFINGEEDEGEEIKGKSKEDEREEEEEKDEAEDERDLKGVEETAEEDAEEKIAKEILSSGDVFM